MKSFILACVAALVLAFGAAFGLDQIQKSAQAAFSSSVSARV